MSDGVLSQLVLPLALFTIMLGVGLSLRPADFRRVLVQPRAVAVGVACQLLLLPLLAILVVWSFQLPAALALGLIIVSAAPGGATSNMITFLCRGDTALSVSMTAVSSLVIPVSLPWVAYGGLWWFGQGQEVPFPVLQTSLKLVVITVLPVVIGMLINHYFAAFCRRMQGVVKLMSVAFLVFVVVGIVRANWERLPEYLGTVMPAGLLLALASMLFGYAIARLVRLRDAAPMTIAIEVGIQNAGTALLLTGGILQNPEMSASALIYGIVMQVPALGLILYRNFGGTRSARATAEASGL